MQPGKNQAYLRNLGAFTKIRRIYRILALFKKSGGSKKSWHFTKIRQIYRILALFKKSGGFTKSRRFTEKQAGDRILAGVKIPAPGEKPAGLEKTGGPLPV